MAMRGFLGRLIFGTIYIAFALADEKSLILESNQHNINENKNLRGRILAQWSSSMNDESNVEALNTNHMPSANPHLNFEPMGSGLLQHPNSATRDLKSYSRRRHRRHGRSNSNTKAKNSLSKRAFRSACHAVAHANIAGRNLPHGHLRNITRWTDCCAACQSRQGCVAWALRLDGNVHQKGCFLKSGKYRVIKNVRYAAYGLNPGSLSPPRSSPHSLPPPTPKQRNPASRGTAGLPPFGGVAPVPTNPKPIVQSPSPKPFESPPQVSAPVYNLPPSPSPIHSPPSPPPSPPPYPPSPPPPSPPLPPPSPPPPPPPAPPPPSPSPPPPAPPRSLLCTPTTARLQHGVAGKRVGTAYYHGCSNQVSSDVECCAACQVNPSCLGFFYERADCSGFGGPFDTGICWQIEDTIATFPSANLTAGTLYSRLPY